MSRPPLHYGNVEIVLACTHVRHFKYAPPKVGERIFCTACNDMQKVTGAPGDYRAVCHSCTGLYRTRKSPEAIRRVVMQHLQKCPDHTVKVWQIGLPEVFDVTLPATGTLQGFDSPDTLL
jgi:hypothetical protein